MDYSRESIIFCSQKGSKKTSHGTILILSSFLVPAARLWSIQGQHFYERTLIWMSWHVDTSHCNLISHNFGLISHVCNVISCYLEITFHSCGMQGLQIDLFPRHKCKKEGHLNVRCPAWSAGIWYLRWRKRHRELEYKRTVFQCVHSSHLLSCTGQQRYRWSASAPSAEGERSLASQSMRKGWNESEAPALLSLEVFRKLQEQKQG